MRILSRSIISITSLLVLALGTQALMNRCTKDVAEPRLNKSQTDTSQCDTLYKSFSQDVEPIFSGNCATSGCHNSSSSAFGIVLETHSQIKDETKNGKVICAIEHESGCSNMPKSAPQLSEEKIRLIRCWAKKGYPND